MYLQATATIQLAIQSIQGFITSDRGNHNGSHNSTSYVGGGGYCESCDMACLQQINCYI